jgi:TRAP-type mannitol/chloroaromatic compound transport system permease small subunit
MRKSLLRFADVVDSINEHLWYWSFIIVIVAFIVVFEVVARDTFTAPTKWAWPVNGQLICAFVVLAGGYNLLHRGHIRMDLLYSRWSSRNQKIVDIFTSFLPLFYYGVLLYFGAQLAWESLITNERAMSGVFSYPRYPLRMVFTIGVFLVLLQVVAQFIRNLLALIVKGEHRT